MLTNPFQSTPITQCDSNILITAYTPWAPTKPETSHTPEHHLKVVLLNAHSVRNKTRELTNLILDNDIDILGLTETWLGTDDHDEVAIGDQTPQGYSFKHIPRSSQDIENIEPHFVLRLVMLPRGLSRPRGSAEDATGYMFADLPCQQKNR